MKKKCIAIKILEIKNGNKRFVYLFIYFYVILTFKCILNTIWGKHQALHSNTRAKKWI